MFTEIHIKIVKHLPKWCFKHIFSILVASKRQTYRFKSSLHVFLFRNRVNRTHAGFKRNVPISLPSVNSSWVEQEKELQLPSWSVVFILFCFVLFSIYCNFLKATKNSSRTTKFFHVPCYGSSNLQHFKKLYYLVGLKKRANGLNIWLNIHLILLNDVKWWSGRQTVSTHQHLIQQSFTRGPRVFSPRLQSRLLLWIRTWSRHWEIK